MLQEASKPIQKLIRAGLGISEVDVEASFSWLKHCTLNAAVDFRGIGASTTHGNSGAADRK